MCINWHIETNFLKEIWICNPGILKNIFKLFFSKLKNVENKKFREIESIITDFYISSNNAQKKHQNRRICLILVNLSEIWEPLSHFFIKLAWKSATILSCLVKEALLAFWIGNRAMLKTNSKIYDLNSYFKHSATISNTIIIK